MTPSVDQDQWIEGKKMQMSTGCLGRNMHGMGRPEEWTSRMRPQHLHGMQLGHQPQQYKRGSVHIRFQNKRRRTCPKIDGHNIKNPFLGWDIAFSEVPLSGRTFSLLLRNII